VNTAKLNLVPFQQAGLCLDCETISASHSSCLVCGSSALLNIARVLSRHRASSVSQAEKITAIPLPAPRLGPGIAFYKGDSISATLNRNDVPAMRFGAENSA
jgi:hypothetical protein